RSAVTIGCAAGIESVIRFALLSRRRYRLVEWSIGTQQRSCLRPRFPRGRRIGSYLPLLGPVAQVAEVTPPPVPTLSSRAARGTEARRRLLASAPPTSA